MSRSRPWSGDASAALLASFVLSLGCGSQTIGTYNTAPSAVVESPADGEHVVWQTATFFRGTVADSEQSLDTLGIEWSSSLDGVLHDEPASADGSTSFESAFLSPGQHTVTLRVADSGGLVYRAEISLFVEAPNQAPTAYIASPANGEVFYDTEAVLMSGTVTDAESPPGDLLCEWVSSLDGQLNLASPDSSGHCIYTATGLTLGSHTLTLRAIDPAGESGEGQVNITVRTQNQAPELAILAPAHGSSWRHGEPILFELQAYDPDGQNTDLVVEIQDDGVVLASGLHPDTTGYLVWSTDDLEEGDHTVTVYALDPDDAYVSRAVQFEVRPPNTCPTAPVAAILPSHPVAGDNLEVEVTVPSTDIDGDDVEYRTRWYRNGTYQPDYALLVPATDTDRGETWRVDVTAWDGACESGASTAQVTIENSPPSITAVSVTPTTVTEATGAACAPSGWSDADGDSPNYTYAWLLNGSVVTGATSSSLDPAWYARGQLLQCQVTPFDGYDPGSPLTSPATVVANTPPGAPGITLSPANPQDDDDLDVDVTTAALDIDGDAVTYRYTWWRDGVEQADLDGQPLVPASRTSPGDAWTVFVSAWDGVAEGPAASASATVRAGAGLLYITEIMYDPEAVSEADGEWIEVYNPGGASVDLFGWVLQDAGGNSHTVAASVFVPARGYAVLGRNADPEGNGGVMVDYEYSGFILDNVDDEVILVSAAVPVDEVAYHEGEDFPEASGRSLALDPAIGDDVTNDQGTAWCPSRTRLDGGDFGTPGEDNDDCACYYQDLDGDGFGPCDPEVPDCDDTDDAVFPGAVEACDGVDNDCDTDVDEGMDADGDGWLACGATPDCDDTNPSVNPGAAEVCDPYDNDCDGTVNEGVGDLWETGSFYYWGTITSGASFSMTMHQATDEDRLRFYVTDDGAADWSIQVQVTGIPSGSDYDLELRKMQDAASEVVVAIAGASFNFGNSPESVTVAQNDFQDQSGYYEARVINTGATTDCSPYTLSVAVH